MSIVGAGCARPSMALTALGEIVENHLLDLSNRYANLHIDKHVVMPNHIHCILIITNDTGRADPAPTTVGHIMGYFKYQTTKMVLQNEKLWQRGYYDHIIRNEEEYCKIWQYIDTNPTKWLLDTYYRTI